MTRSRNIFLSSLLAFLAAAAPLARAQYRMDPPPAGESIPVKAEIKPRPGAALPTQLYFIDAVSGKPVKLGDLFNHNKPVILSLVYFSCPSLCNLNQKELAEQVKAGPGDLQLGKDYDIIVVSIDPDDTPELAREKRANYLGAMGRTPSQSGFTYLTGTDVSIATLADTIGFEYKRNPDPNTPDGKFGHATGIFICTPEGRLSQTIQGVQYDPEQLHDTLVHASAGTIGSTLLNIGLSCGAMRYDPATGKFVHNPWFYAGTAGGLASILGVGTFLAFMWRGEIKRKKLAANSADSRDPGSHDSRPSSQD